MENASKALIMAASILIGLLLLALMFTMFLTARDVSISYDERKSAELIQRFNTNFTKYMGQDLTIHEVITICNFANIKNNQIANVLIEGQQYSQENIKQDLIDSKDKLSTLEGYYNVEVIYKLKILTYDKRTGYISKIKIEEPTNRFKCYKKDINTGETIIEYKS